MLFTGNEPVPQKDGTHNSAGYQNHWTESDKQELGIEKLSVSRHNHVNHAKSTTSLASLQVVQFTVLFYPIYAFFKLNYFWNGKGEGMSIFHFKNFFWGGYFFQGALERLDLYWIYKKLHCTLWTISVQQFLATDRHSDILTDILLVICIWGS